MRALVSRLSLVVAGLLCGCSSAPSEPTAGSADEVTASDPHAFPKKFLFGTAIAGFQVDMGCPTLAASRCEDRRSDWYQWSTSPIVDWNPLEFMSRQRPSAGPGFFELYAEDMDRAKNELHNNALRLSIEWSRIFPTPTFGVEGNDALRKIADPNNLAYYHALFAALHARGMKPMVTINHYTLPTWIHDGVGCNLDFDHCAHRGWADGAVIVPEIAKYAGFVAAEFGGEVDDWATLNEPFTAVVLPSYLTPTPTRSNPPGLHLRVDAARAATIAMIEAHARMYDAVHANDTKDADGDGKAARVGLVYNMQAVAPFTNNEADARAAKDARYFMNEMFLNGVVRGDLDRAWDGKIVHRQDLAGRMDFLGINYYVLMKAQALPFSFGLDHVSKFITFNLLDMHLDWQHASGIRDVLLEASHYGVPLIVAETGVDDAAQGADGAAWVTETLAWTRQAMREGAPVEGYFYWSLMDNYEWNHGTNMHFGLYAVDPHTKERRARSAVRAYGRIAGAGRIPDDLAERYGTP